MDAIQEIIIIGSGPAAHTAAIYAGRATLSPLIFEGEMAGGVAPGGQLTTTTDVENFPGFANGIQGPELMMEMRQQSINCGATILTKTVTSVDLSKSPFVVTTSDKQYSAKALIISTGATAKRMAVEGEDLFWQKGISACAVCDGALPLFRQKPLVVVGGGDSACEEATYLTKFASTVTLLVRRDELRASKTMQNRVFNNEKITILWNTILTKASGDRLLKEVTVENVKTNEQQTLPTSGLFYAIGHTPNTAFLDNQLDTDDTGYIITKPGTTHTSIPGVYACGDVQDKKYRQAITAAGTGCMAALEAENFLTEHH